MGWSIEDPASQNGTCVNGERIVRRALLVGEHIELVQRRFASRSLKPDDSFLDLVSGSCNRGLPVQPGGYRMSILVLLSSIAFGGGRVGLCYADSYWGDVADQIGATKMFVKVTAFNCGTSTPSVLTLLNQDAVLVWSNSSFSNATNLGDNLADYVDAGGGVVEAVFANGSVALTGRFDTGAYEPIKGSLQSSGIALTSIIDDPGHPIMNGVSFLNGGTASYHTADATYSATAASVAHWSNGLPLVGADDTHAGRTVGLNLFPPSTGARGDFWESATDGEWIMANALDWASGDPVGPAANPVLTVTGVCPGAVTIDIVGGSPDGALTIYSGTGIDIAANVPHGMCAGTNFGLQVATARKTIDLDAGGGAALTLIMGAGPCGMPLAVVDRTTCGFSNIAFIP